MKTERETCSLVNRAVEQYLHPDCVTFGCKYGLGTATVTWVLNE